MSAAIRRLSKRENSSDKNEYQQDKKDDVNSMSKLDATSELFSKHNYLHKDIEKKISKFIRNNTDSYFIKKKKCPISKDCIEKIKKHLKGHLTLEKISSAPLSSHFQINTVFEGMFKSDLLYQNFCLSIFNIYQTMYRFYGPNRLFKDNYPLFSVMQPLETIDEEIDMKTDNYLYEKSKSVFSIDYDYKLTNHYVSNLIYNYMSFSDEKKKSLLNLEGCNLSQNHYWIYFDDISLQCKLEPIHAYISIHDLSSNKKVSETLCIDGKNFMNGIENLKKHVLYSCRQSNLSSLYLILRIEKTLEKAKYRKYSQFYSSVNDAVSQKQYHSYVKNFLPSLKNHHTYLGYNYIPLSEIYPNISEISEEKLINMKCISSMPNLTEYFKSLTKIPPKPILISRIYVSENVLTYEQILKQIKEQKLNQNNTNKRLNYIPVSLLMFVKGFQTRILEDNPDIGNIHPYLNRMTNEFPSEKVTTLKTIFQSQKFPHLKPVNYLYIYPKSLNFLKFPKEVKTLQIEFYFLESEPTEVIDFLEKDRFSHENRRVTSVSYSDQNPTFNDEIKFEIPQKNHPSFHLLILFTNIRISQTYSINKCVVGFSWLLIDQYSISPNGLYNLPVANCLYPGYLKSGSITNVECDARFMENKKPLFTVYIKFWTSINLDNAEIKSSVETFKLLKFFDKVEEKLFNLCVRLRMIAKLPQESLVKNFIILLNFYFEILEEVIKLDSYQHINNYLSRIYTEIFKSFIDVVEIFYASTKYMQNTTNGSNEWLLQYIQCYCFNSKIPSNLYEFSSTPGLMSYIDFDLKFLFVLCKTFESEIYQVKILSNIDIYLELLLKSILVKKIEKRKLTNDRIQISDMNFQLIKLLIQNCSKGVEIFSNLKFTKKIKFLIECIERFLKSLFFMIDRGMVLELIHVFITELINYKDLLHKYTISSILINFLSVNEIIMVDILLIIFINIRAFESFGYYNPKNNLKLCSKAISNSYIFQTWYVAVQNDIKYFDESSFSCKFIAAFGKFLYKIDNFTLSDFFNYNKSEHSNLSPFIAQHIFPFCSIVQNIRNIYLNTTMKKSNNISVNPGSLKPKENIEKKYFSDISNYQNKLYPIFSNSLYSYLNSVRGIYMVFFWIVRAIPECIFISAVIYWNIDTKMNIIQFLMSSEMYFKEYEDDVSDSHFEELKFSEINGLKMGKSLKYTPQRTSNFTPHRSSKQNDQYLKYSIRLNTSLILIFNETVLYILKILFDNTSDSSYNSGVYYELVLFLIQLLKNEHAENFKGSIIRLIYLNVKKMSIILCTIDYEKLFDFVSSIIYHCNSKYSNVREESVKIIFTLVAINYEKYPNLCTIKNILIQEISNIVFGSPKIKMNPNLRGSIMSLSIINNKIKPIFYTDMKNIIDDILFIFDEYQSLLANNSPFFSNIEVLYSFVDRISNTPEINLLWLLRIRLLLIDQEYYFQAGLSLVYILVILFQQLRMKYPFDKIVVHCSEILKKISSNSYVVGITQTFSNIESKNESNENKIIYIQKYTKEAIMYFIQSKAYNYAIFLNDILKWISMSQGVIVSSSLIHETYENTVISIEKNKEFIPEMSYFRVKIINNSIIHDEGEFVYCAQPHFKLAEFTKKIIEYFTNLTKNPEMIEIIRDSAKLDYHNLCKEKVYIQITNVTPLAEKYLTIQNILPYNPKDYCNFYFYTPFTLDGKSHGEIIEQYQKKTVITTHAYLPSIIPREKIIKIFEIVMEPIEVIQEDIMKRNIDIEHVISQEEVNIKMLQLNLQGCIATSVNQGPYEAARVFLEPFLYKKFRKDCSEEHLNELKNINKLVIIFRLLTETCRKALEILSKVSVPLEKEYIDHMNQLFKEYERKIQLLLTETSLKLNKYFL